MTPNFLSDWWFSSDSIINIKILVLEQAKSSCLDNPGRDSAPENLVSQDYDMSLC